MVDDRLPDGLTTGPIVLARERSISEQAASLRDRSLSAARATGVPTRVDVAPGNPADVLAALCTRVDLMVIGSGHAAPRGHVYLGRAGTALVDGAPCAVLIAPRPADDPAI